MTVKTWPTIGDYSTAVQMPDRVFGVPEIAAAEFATRPPLHLPVAASGANAVVFRATVAGATTAVRCFTREPGEERTRYLAFADHVARAGLHALTPPRWHDDAIHVADAWRPVVTMPWITGQPLHRWIEDHLGQPAKLVALAESWSGLLADLIDADVAHGDLQHGNVLVDSTGKLHLIDFDGVWIPQIAHVLPTEWGHPNYQHPERGEQGTWGRYIDWFAGLVIDLSLRAVAADPSLWEFNNEENLILTEDDYRGGTAIWDRLAQSPNEIVRDRARLLATGCAYPASLEIDLATILLTGFDQAGSPGSTGSTGSAAPSQRAGTGAADWWVDLDSAAGTEGDPASRDDALDQNGSDSTSGVAWSVDATGRIVTPWATTGQHSSRGDAQTPGQAQSRGSTGGGHAPGGHATTVPPDRQRTVRQAVNSSWDDEPIPAGRSRPASSPPPPPGSSGTNQPPPQTSSVPSPGSPIPAPAPPSGVSFALMIVVALGAIVAITALVDEPAERNVLLAITVGVVLVNLLREMFDR